jgi:hypothetical protein
MAPTNQEAGAGRVHQALLVVVLKFMDIGGRELGRIGSHLLRRGELARPIGLEYVFVQGPEIWNSSLSP